ncbi:hypothetical protein [Neobacillus mesonae]|uniref:hypothetical protein n=1 Tax=Neobacillus mesonae TaxID=1193713 RepID=UPI0013E0D3B3|nr:hypothetical protein [Neobacillus mesonae]
MAAMFLTTEAVIAKIRRIEGNKSSSNNISELILPPILEVGFFYKNFDVKKEGFNQ